MNSEEMIRSLRGAWQLCLGNGRGLDLFERSFEAFWRSFFALIVAAPIYALHLSAERRLKMAGGVTTAAQSGEGAFYLINSASYVVDWLAFPVAMIFIARLIGLTRRYSLYITAYNWSTVLVIAVISPPFILRGFGVISEGVANVASLAVFIFALRARYMVAVIALEANRATAAALVAIELILSLIIAQATLQLTG